MGALQRTSLPWSAPEMRTRRRFGASPRSTVTTSISKSANSCVAVAQGSGQRSTTPLTRARTTRGAPSRRSRRLTMDGLGPYDVIALVLSVLVPVEEASLVARRRRGEGRRRVGPPVADHDSSGPRVAAVGPPPQGRDRGEEVLLAAGEDEAVVAGVERHSWLDSRRFAEGLHGEPLQPASGDVAAERANRVHSRRASGRRQGEGDDDGVARARRGGYTGQRLVGGMQSQRGAPRPAVVRRHARVEQSRAVVTRALEVDPHADPR